MQQLLATDHERLLAAGSFASVQACKDVVCYQPCQAVACQAALCRETSACGGFIAADGGVCAAQHAA